MIDRKTGVLTAVVLGLALTACSKTSSSEAEPNSSSSVAQTSRCIQSAIGEGYKSGQCAYSYVDACVTTQSKEEMRRALQTDRMLGAVGQRGCPNMPTTYSSQFEAVSKAADKF